VAGYQGNRVKKWKVGEMGRWKEGTRSACCENASWENNVKAEELESWKVGKMEMWEKWNNWEMANWE